MIVIDRGNLVFYIKEECITVAYNNWQYFSYSVYALQNRKPFYNFKNAILESTPDKFRNILEVVSLGAEHGLISSGTIKPNLEGVKYEKRP